jgi:hypothetical protein
VSVAHGCVWLRVREAIGARPARTNYFQEIGPIIFSASTRAFDGQFSAPQQGGNYAGDSEAPAGVRAESP